MSDSDIEIKKIAPMKPVKKPPSSPTEELLKSQERKISTRLMIHEALKELKTRKGVSSYAIKKYLEEKYNVETDKVKYLIKKTLKSGVEDGSIVQVKGIGASGSFKLVAVKEKPKKKPKMNKEKTKEKSTKEKSTKEKSTKEKKVKEKPKKEKMEKADKKKKDKGSEIKVDVEDAKDKVKKKVKLSEIDKKGKKEVKEKAAEKRKGSKAEATPAKKRAIMMKRKSIGTIIKPPKMKPKKA